MTLRSMVALCAFALMTTACADEAGSTGGTTDWPSFGFDHANSLNNPSETALSPETVGDLEEAWRLEGGAVSGTPIVVGGVVFFADWDGTVHAVDSFGGDVLWSTAVSDVPISGTVAVTDELIVAGDLGGVLHAVDRETGEGVWSVELEPRGASLFGSPIVVDDAVVIGMTDSELQPDHPDFRASIVALALADGSERWRLYTDTGEDSDYWVTVWSSAAHDPERRLIYIGTGDTNQPGSGGPGSAAERAPVDLPLADGVLALHEDTGEIAWFFKLVEEDMQRDFDVGAAPNLFTIDGRDVVGVGGKSGDYVVLDRDTGEMIWQTHLSEGSAIGGVMTTAAVGDGVIYVASNDGGFEGGTVFALDAGDGSVMWSQRFDPPIIGGMALANGVLYRGTFGYPNSGTVVALRASDGTILWSDDVGSPLAGGFSVVDGTLFVGYGSGAPPELVAGPGGIIAYRLP